MSKGHGGSFRCSGLRRCLLAALVMLAAAATDARPARAGGGTAPGEYSATYDVRLDADPEGQDCGESFHNRGTFAFGLHVVDGVVVLVPRAGFPMEHVIRLSTVDGRSYTGTDDTTMVSLTVRGKRVQGVVYADRRCSPGYTFKGTWKRKPEPAPPPMCTPDPATCDGETMCLDGTCVAAFGRVYLLAVNGITVPLKKPNGESWDGLGGAPDLAASLTLNGTKVLSTGATRDSYTMEPSKPSRPTVIPAGSTLKLDVWDSDAAVDDPAFACSFFVDADMLHVGQAACSGDIGSAIVTFSPQSAGY